MPRLVHATIPASIESARRMALNAAPGQAAVDWSTDMAGVATRRDRDAFLRIYDHFLPRLCQYLRGLGAADPVAEDLAQESLLRLWQRADAYDPARGAVSTWLFRIARNLHIDRVRREPLQPFAEPPESVEREPAGDHGATEDYAAHVQLQRRIDALPPVQARLIRMSYFEARSHQDIATDLGMPLGTVKSHLRRALLRLQGDMGGIS